jgi:hypothetical protein
MFHPRDYAEITSTIGFRCQTFAVLANPHLLSSTLEEEDEWVVQSTPTNIKTAPTVYIRLPAVHTCQRLRIVKRALSEEIESR